MIVRAPGKAMLIGEYAVLDGGPAVVAAVDCYAEARLYRGRRETLVTSPFISNAMAEAAVEIRRAGRDASSSQPSVNTDAFSRDGNKLGLGSSAAATVAAVAVLFAEAGLDLEDSNHRAAMHRAARRAHDAAQGVAGSGADVLASSFGGLQTLNSDEARGLSLPDGLSLRLVATSTSASTADLITRYRAVGAAVSPAQNRMTEAARRFIAACRDNDAVAVLAAVAAAQDAFFALGRAIDRDLVTDEHRAIAAAALRASGAAKPSGAGGGDLAVVFLPSAQVAAFEAELSPLPFTVSARGAHVVSTLEQA